VVKRIWKRGSEEDTPLRFLSGPVACSTATPQGTTISASSETPAEQPALAIRFPELWAQTFAHIDEDFEVAFGVDGLERLVQRRRKRRLIAFLLCKDAKTARRMSSSGIIADLTLYSATQCDYPKER